MSLEVTIAIITAIASLLVAIVSLVNSIISNRQSSQSAKMIEILKHELADKQSTQEWHDKYLAKSMESLERLIEVVQQLKDMIQLVVSATDTNLDTQTTVENIRKLRESLFKCYEEQLPNLKEGEAQGAHRAKNLALIIETNLKAYLSGTEYVEISEEQRQTLTELRNRLTDSQNLLRDSRTHLLIERLGSK
jgi:hypothetical protein